MPAKGCVRVPDPVTEDVLRVIAGMSEREVFGTEHIHAKLPRLKLDQIRAVLREKTRQGALDRVGRGLYRKGGTRVKTSTPKGLVPEAVWATLLTNSGKSVGLAEIVGEVEAHICRPGYSAYRTVAAILSRWHRDGHLRCVGKKNNFTYRLKEGITERPLSIK
jgi:hypothetical protein